MKVSHNITDTEKSVMDILWDRPDAVATRELLDLMKEKGKNWKRQTLNTLLFRLEEKGIVNRTRAYVQPALSREERARLLSAAPEQFYRCRPRNCWMISMGVSPLISSPHLQDAQS